MAPIEFSIFHMKRGLGLALDQALSSLSSRAKSIDALAAAIDLEGDFRTLA